MDENDILSALPLLIKFPHPVYMEYGCTAQHKPSDTWFLLVGDNFDFTWEDKSLKVCCEKVWELLEKSIEEN